MAERTVYHCQHSFEADDGAGYAECKRMRKPFAAAGAPRGIPEDLVADRADAGGNSDKGAESGEKSKTDASSAAPRHRPDEQKVVGSTAGPPPPPAAPYNPFQCSWLLERDEVWNWEVIRHFRAREELRHRVFPSGAAVALPVESASSAVIYDEQEGDEDGQHQAQRNEGAQPHKGLVEERHVDEEEERANIDKEITRTLQQEQLKQQVIQTKEESVPGDFLAAERMRFMPRTVKEQIRQWVVSRNADFTAFDFVRIVVRFFLDGNKKRDAHIDVSSDDSRTGKSTTGPHPHDVDVEVDHGPEEDVLAAILNERNEDHLPEPEGQEGYTDPPAVLPPKTNEHRHERYLRLVERARQSKSNELPSKFLIYWIWLERMGFPILLVLSRPLAVAVQIIRLKMLRVVSLCRAQLYAWQLRGWLQSVIEEISTRTSTAGANINGRRNSKGVEGARGNKTRVVVDVEEEELSLLKQLKQVLELHILEFEIPDHGTAALDHTSSGASGSANTSASFLHAYMRRTCEEFGVGSRLVYEDCVCDAFRREQEKDKHHSASSSEDRLDEEDSEQGKTADHTASGSGQELKVEHQPAISVGELLASLLSDAEKENKKPREHHYYRGAQLSERSDSISVMNIGAWSDENVSEVQKQYWNGRTQLPESVRKNRISIDIVLPVCAESDVEDLDISVFPGWSRIFFYDLCGEFGRFLPSRSASRTSINEETTSKMPTTASDTNSFAFHQKATDKTYRVFSAKELLDSKTSLGDETEETKSKRAQEVERFLQNPLAANLLDRCAKFRADSVFFDDSHEEDVRTLDVGVRFWHLAKYYDELPDVTFMAHPDWREHATPGIMQALFEALERGQEWKREIKADVVHLGKRQHGPLLHEPVFPTRKIMSNIKAATRSTTSIQEDHDAGATLTSSPPPLSLLREKFLASDESKAFGVVSSRGSVDEGAGRESLLMWPPREDREDVADRRDSTETNEGRLSSAGEEIIVDGQNGHSTAGTVVSQPASFGGFVSPETFVYHQVGLESGEMGDFLNKKDFEMDDGWYEEIENVDATSSSARTPISPDGAISPNYENDGPGAADPAGFSGAEIENTEVPLPPALLRRAVDDKAKARLKSVMKQARIQKFVEERLLPAPSGDPVVVHEDEPEHLMKSRSYFEKFRTFVKSKYFDAAKTKNPIKRGKINYEEATYHRLPDAYELQLHRRIWNVLFQEKFTLPQHHFGGYDYGVFLLSKAAVLSKARSWYTQVAFGLQSVEHTWQAFFSGSAGFEQQAPQQERRRDRSRTASNNFYRAAWHNKVHRGLSKTMFQPDALRGPRVTDFVSVRVDITSTPKIYNKAICMIFEHLWSVLFAYVPRSGPFNNFESEKNVLVDPNGRNENELEFQFGYQGRSSGPALQRSSRGEKTRKSRGRGRLAEVEEVEHHKDPHHDQQTSILLKSRFYDSALPLSLRLEWHPVARSIVHFENLWRTTRLSLLTVEERCAVQTFLSQHPFYLERSVIPQFPRICYMIQ
ncbi:unnamed protein product [Amoebophrya sp. A120]|nr:unnamed protein product [Amoebophrya sp. A120]|eukprot:GSA120T00012468001.1